MHILKSVAYVSTLASIACVSAVALLAACNSNPNDGYYDSSGKFIPYNPQNRNSANHAPNSAAAQQDDGTHYVTYEYGSHGSAPVIVHVYDRAGVYDYNGYYFEAENGPSVPADMFPTRGMCRIWFTNRPYSEEPRVESCRGIQSRVPTGAYVLYGGSN